MSQSNGSNGTVTENKKEFVSSSGITVHLIPVSILMLEAYDRYHKPPKPPMREVELAGGAKDQVPDEDNPEYKAILAQHLVKATDDFLNMLLEFGVEVELPTDNTWLKRLQRTGIVIDPGEERQAYLRYIVFKDFFADFKSIVNGVMSMSGVDEERIANLASLF